MELIKYYNQNKEYIKTLERGHNSAKGLWYNIVIALIVNLKSQKLYLQLDTKNNLQLSAGGHVQHNEEIEDAITREMMEETGINTYDCELLNTFTYKYCSKNQFHKYFIYNADVSLNSFHINDKDEILSFIEIEIDELLNQSNCIAKMKDESKRCIVREQILKAFNGGEILNKVCNIIKNLPSF